MQHLSPSTEGSATIDNIDISAAMKMPGAVAVLTAKDIPGSNTFMPPPSKVEEIFSSGPILYAGQPVALCIAVHLFIQFFLKTPVF
ncbi:xanthine dehydrogenase-like [Latimeria chalumnae]|uniref:xanthine dehydrogenase-like n=1 Tax=Latimeria chalumnae TaxID=7897 RepID=UPI00313AB0D6